MYLIVSQHLKVFNTADFETLKMYFQTSVSNTFQCSKYILKKQYFTKKQMYVKKKKYIWKYPKDFEFAKIK